jgi:hypothetical protein
MGLCQHVQNEAVPVVGLGWRVGVQPLGDAGVRIARGGVFDRDLVLESRYPSAKLEGLARLGVQLSKLERAFAPPLPCR